MFQKWQILWKFLPAVQVDLTSLAKIGHRPQPFRVELLPVYLGKLVRVDHDHVFSAGFAPERFVDTVKRLRPKKLLQLKGFSGKPGQCVAVTPGKKPFELVFKPP